MRRVLIAVVLAGVAVPAAAQPAPWAPERMTPGWVFTPSIVFGGLWDSNVAVRSEFNPETSEWVGLVNPRGEVDFNGRRAKFNAGYSGTLEAYRNIDELTRYDQRGRMEARFQMTPRLQFSTRQQMTLSPTTDQLEIGGLPFRRIGSRMLDTHGGFAYDISPRAQVSADYFFQWVQFDRNDPFAPDDTLLQGGHAHSPTAELKYALSRRLKIGGLYSYRHASIDGDEQLIDTQQAEGVLELVVGPATTVRGKGGVAYLRISDTEETQLGPSFGASITHRARRVLMNAGYERSFIPSFGFGGVTANQVFDAGVTAPFLQGRLYASGSFTFRKNDPVLSRGLTIDLDSYWVQGTVGYAIARWLRMEGFCAVNHQNRQGSLLSAVGTVDRTRAGVQFVTTKPMRIQ